ncbi:terminase [bacterium]|nr:terminase [bacterium]|tara:strand:+ start:1314 stop:1712 length:399 start_codon:yes stop_codon:yes gene_type:complete
MSKVDQKLDELLDIQGEIVQAEKNLPTVQSNDQDKGNDYKYSREIFYGLIERGQDSIEGILEIAKESEHPRVYEVAGQLIKTVSETTEKLIDLQAKMKQLDKDDTQPDKVQNNLFVGSSAELQKLLKQNAQE